MKAKIVERLKTVHVKKGFDSTQRARQESQKISTLRDTHALRRGQMALQKGKEEKK